VNHAFHQRHRRAVREFLDLIEAHVPRRLEVHIIMDNYSTHKTAADSELVRQNVRDSMCTTPRPPRLMAESGRALVRRAHHETDPSGVPQRDAAESRHQEFIDAHQTDPKPFVVDEMADEIWERRSIRSADRRRAGHTTNDHEPRLQDTTSCGSRRTRSSSRKARLLVLPDVGCHAPEERRRPVSQPRSTAN